MKVAIKPLTDSDLALFEAHAGRSRLRAIELSGDVFVDKFYPGLRGALEQVIVSLVLMGPGGSSARQLTRAVQRARGSTNWRLSGEPIYDSVEEPGSYDALTAGDFGVFAFEGTARPAIVTLILVSARKDARLHDAIATRCVFMEPSSMVAVSDSIIAELRAATNGSYDGAHPLDVLGFRDTVEDVLFGDTVSVPLSNPMLMSRESLLRQLLLAEETRQRGEELFGGSCILLPLWRTTVLRGCLGLGMVRRDFGFFPVSSQLPGMSSRLLVICPWGLQRTVSGLTRRCSRLSWRPC